MLSGNCGPPPHEEMKTLKIRYRPPGRKAAGSVFMSSKELWSIFTTVSRFGIFFDKIKDILVDLVTEKAIKNNE